MAAEDDRSAHSRERGRDHEKARHGTTGSSVGSCSAFTSAGAERERRAEARLGGPGLAALEGTERVPVLAGRRSAAGILTVAARPPCRWRSRRARPSSHRGRAARSCRAGDTRTRSAGVRWLADGPPNATSSTFAVVFSLSHCGQRSRLRGECRSTYRREARLRSAVAVVQPRLPRTSVALVDDVEDQHPGHRRLACR